MLVTGAAGFIGQSLCKKLNCLGYDTLGASRRKSIAKNQVYIDDISNLDDLKGFLSETSTIIHLAARVHVSKETTLDPLSEFRRVNADATAKLAMASAIAGVERFVFMSSVGVNGAETFGRPFSSDDIPQPNSDYAISKHEAELKLKNISDITGMEYVVVRPPLVYGQNAPGNFRTLVRFVKFGFPLPFGLVTSNRRSYIYRENLTDFVVKCVSSPAAKNKTFLVSDGEELSTADFLRRISFAAGRKPRLFGVSPLVLTHAARSFGLQEQASRLLGDLQMNIEPSLNCLQWRPPMCVEDGLRESVRSLPPVG